MVNDTGCEKKQVNIPVSCSKCGELELNCGCEVFG